MNSKLLQKVEKVLYIYMSRHPSYPIIHVFSIIL